jgi:hypothetical protein
MQDDFTYQGESAATQWVNILDVTCTNNCQHLCHQQYKNNPKNNLPILMYLTGKIFSPSLCRNGNVSFTLSFFKPLEK